MRRLRWLAAACAVLISCGLGFADNVAEADRLLCASSTAAICDELGECASGSPRQLNIPQFIEVNLEEKTLNTTAASGEERSTAIKNLERHEGIIVVQGFERGRAFSFVIEEATGLTSIAVARDGLAVVVFGACTPIE